MVAVLLAAIAALASACGGEEKGKGATMEDILKSAQHEVHLHAEEPLACKDCHENVANQYLPPKSWKCSACHELQRLILHDAASTDSSARECWSCHDFTGATKSPTPCMSCHEQPQGKLPMIAPHDPARPEEDCSQCHSAHKESSPEARECEGCHDKEKVSGHDKPDIRKRITGCASCHQYHGKAIPASNGCIACHRKSQAKVPRTATFEGHDTCVHCHKPHRFFKSEVAPCAECHVDVHALSQDKVAKHRGCIGCHDKHDVRKPVQPACEGCHKKIKPSHPEIPESGTKCVGCHKPHNGPSESPAMPCSSCHELAASDDALHQGARRKGPACIDCHRPHAFDRIAPEPSLCLGCHGAKPFKNAKRVHPYQGHRVCVRCHGKKVAHQPAGKPVACGSCHDDKVELVRKDHSKCVACHEPHSTELIKQCGACHRDQAEAVFKGRHRRQCVTCHEPHSAEVTEPCSRCHKRHARTAPKDHKRCVQCHNPHSARLTETCTPCHKEQVPGMHE